MLIDKQARALAGSTRQSTRGTSVALNLSAGGATVGVPGSAAGGGESNWFIIALHGGASNQLALLPTKARKGDLITVTNEETGAGIAHTVEDQASATVIATFTATVKGHVVCEFDGANWVVRERGNGVV